MRSLAKKIAGPFHKNGTSEKIIDVPLHGFFSQHINIMQQRMANVISILKLNSVLRKGIRNG
jgi:hypothetical protein